MRYERLFIASSCVWKNNNTTRRGAFTEWISSCKKKKPHQRRDEPPEEIFGWREQGFYGRGERIDRTDIKDEMREREEESGRDDREDEKADESYRDEVGNGDPPQEKIRDEDGDEVQSDGNPERKERRTAERERLVGVGEGGIEPVTGIESDDQRKKSAASGAKSEKEERSRKDDEGERITEKSPRVSDAARREFLRLRHEVHLIIAYSLSVRIVSMFLCIVVSPIIQKRDRSGALAQVLVSFLHHQLRLESFRFEFLNRLLCFSGELSWENY